MDKVVLNDSIIDINLLDGLVSKHMKDIAQYTHSYDLYKGKHAIENKRVLDPLKPCNKLVNDYYGQIIDTTIGYFLGKPIVVNSVNDSINTELDNIFNSNDKDDLFMEVGKEMCIKGKSAVMVYQNEDSETKLVRVPAEEVLFIYDNRQVNTIKYAIRVYDVNITSNDANEVKKVRHAEVWGKDSVCYYKQVEGLWCIDSDVPVNPQPHIFGEVPIIEFVNNEESMGDLAKIESLVDDFDKIFSLMSDEQEAFRNAYLMIKNMTMGSDTLAKLKEEGIIEVMEDGDVKFITKDLQVDAVNSHLDRLKDSIHKFAQVPDLSDEKFAGNLSGVAIRFKLFGLENKCIIKERKMLKAIKQLLRVLTQPILVRTGQRLLLQDMEIIFTRNVPDNLTEITDTVSKLNGVVDKETLLSLLPFIDNPKAILEKLEEEKDAMAQEMKKFGMEATKGDKTEVEDSEVVISNE